MDSQSNISPNKIKTRNIYSADFKLQITRKAEAIGIKEAAKEFGVGQSSISKWTKKYRKEGIDTLVSKSRRPHHSPKKTSQWIIDKIINF